MTLTGWSSWGRSRELSEAVAEVFISIAERNSGTAQKLPGLLTYLLNYLLNPCSQVLLEKRTGFQPVKKFPAFYGTRRFFTTFTNARHLSLS
jgi:hypothetical protein